MDTAADPPEKYKVFDKTIDPKIQEYLKWERNECHQAFIKNLVKQKDLKHLKQLLTKRLDLSFGGIRGDMVPGFNAINDLVIIQTGQGLIKYLEEVDQDTLKEFGIVLGYDGRYNSRRYAEITATIFVNQNYPVKMFGKEVISPFVSFAVTKYNCVAGIMIGGGSSVKDFNGFKIYGSNGCLVIPPADLAIEYKIVENLEPIEDSWNSDILEISEMLSDPYMEVEESYLKLVSDSVFQDYKAIAAKAVIKFVYTPLHGVSFEIMKKVADNHCLMVEPVPDQKLPNPAFPTVKIPNPEEPKVLDKAKQFADKNKIRYILAGDPDGCRMVIGEKRKDVPNWKIYSGNEMGALLGWWALNQYKQTAENPTKLNNVYMIASTVSSRILRSMACVEKFGFIETLPGFKWIGNQAYDLKNQGKKTIFSFEENYGFMFSDDLFDKDAIQASMQMMTLICFLEAKGVTLNDTLEDIYTTYGFHMYVGSYFRADDYETIVKIFENLRQFEDTGKDTGKDTGNCTCMPEAYRNSKQKGCSCNPFPPSPNIKKYPRSIGKGKFQIARIRDITIGFDNSEPTRTSVLPAQPDMEMITFEFVNGLVATLRTNPKEPKLRYCAELISTPETRSPNETTRLVNELLHKMVHEFISPGKNGLSLP